MDQLDNNIKLHSIQIKDGRDNNLVAQPLDVPVEGDCESWKKDQDHVPSSVKNLIVNSLSVDSCRKIDLDTRVPGE